jgi:integration host factor subunit alpha
MSEKNISKDIIASEISESFGYSKNQSLEMVDDIIDGMKEIIVTDGSLKIKDFGVFSVKTRKAGIGRNPKTKEEFPVPAKETVSFKATKKFKTFIKGEK